MHRACGSDAPSMWTWPRPATPSAITALTVDGRDASSLQLMALPPMHGRL